MSNQQLSGASAFNPHVHTAEAVQHFFSCFDDAHNVNEILWDMFAESITNPDAPTDHMENGRRTFLYKRLTELMLAIEPKQ